MVAESGLNPPTGQVVLSIHVAQLKWANGSNLTQPLLVIEDSDEDFGFGRMMRSRL